MQASLRVGSKLLVSNNKGWNMAEILAIRFQEKGLEETQYYIHFEGFNKRLDEWVPFSRLDPKSVTEDYSTQENKKRKEPGAGKAIQSKGKQLEVIQAQGIFSKEKELEKLRTSGSMTQSQDEIGRLKNIDQICIGKYQVDTWYFSPYPEQFTSLPVMFLCEFCLEAVGGHLELERHRLKCTLQHPPGNEIYRNDDLSFFEIDGRKQRRYCRNLCLLSKLFLDHKTLYYDVDPFLFYLMTKTDDRGMHLVGYFSKEKLSAEDYNVACILTLPQFQRKGFGKLLIAFSYELSKVERKIGSPEKPLSDLGLLSYRSFWTDAIIELLVIFKGEISITEISEATAFHHDDILHTLRSMDLLKYYKGQFVLFLSEDTITKYEKNLKRQRVTIDPAMLDWIPPKFQPSQLRFL